MTALETLRNQLQSHNEPTFHDGLVRILSIRNLGELLWYLEHGRELPSSIFFDLEVGKACGGLARGETRLSTDNFDFAISIIAAIISTGDFTSEIVVELNSHSPESINVSRLADWREPTTPDRPDIEYFWHPYNRLRLQLKCLQQEVAALPPRQVA